MILLDLTHLPTSLTDSQEVDRWINTNPELAYPLPCVDDLEQDFEYWVGLVEEFGQENKELEDDPPYIELTVGVAADGQTCGWQTGDNSFSGAAYHHPHWAVICIQEDSCWEDVKHDIKDQIWDLAELQSFDEWGSEMILFSVLYAEELSELAEALKEEGLTPEQIKTELGKWEYEQRNEDGKG